MISNRFTVDRIFCADVTAGATPQHTAQTISIHGLQPKDRIWSVRWRMGKARARFERNDFEKPCTIIFYHVNIYKYPAVLQLHFYDQQLFYGKCIIQHTQQEPLNNVVKMISERYQLPLSDANFTITYCHASQLEGRLSTNFELNYFLDQGTI